MNDVADRLNSSAPHERSTGANERHGLAVGLGFAPAPESRRNISRKVAAGAVVFLWTGRIAATTVYRQLTMAEGASRLILPRTLICVAGAIISIGIIFAQDSRHGSRLWVRACWAIILAIAGAAALALVNHLVFSLFVDAYGRSSPLWEMFTVEFLDQLWIFACVSAMALALCYSAEIREREERISTLQALAKDAQLSALRSQLNPHFLFNALNSIAALIKGRRNSQAEAMAENLADFLRMTLALDPQRLITVEEEVRLQQLYLEIQQVRFPDRLKIRYEISPESRKALVPNLIAQPLVENSIKYAVARSTEPVTVTISANSEGPLLRMCVEDDGGNAAGEAQKGARMGLRNVAERLRLEYGNRAQFQAEAKLDGGFRNVLSIPLAYA